MPVAIAPEDHIGRRLRFRDLQVFFAVVDSGSMAKAALRLGMTQPAVSDIVAGLEQMFGVRLFDRNPRGVEPTIYGRAILKRGRAAFDELRQGIKDIDFLSRRPPTSSMSRRLQAAGSTGTRYRPMFRSRCGRRISSTRRRPTCSRL